MSGGVTVRRLRERHRIRIWVVVTLVVLDLFAVTTFCGAESEKIEVRLHEIRLEVSQTEKTIGGLTKEFAKLKRDEKTLNGELETLATAEQELSVKSVETGRRKEKLMRDVEAAERRVAEHQARIRDRLRSLYIHSSVTGRPQYIGLVGRKDLERTAVYARSVRAFDEAKFQDVKRAVNELIKSREQLEVTLRDSERVQGQLQSKRAELEAKRVALQGVINEIRGKKQAAQLSLAKLRVEAVKMEDLLRSITTDVSEDKPEPSGGPVTEPTLDATATPPEVGSVGNAGVDSQVKIEDVMHPDGLFGKGVRISYPVKGELVRSFGRSKVMDFSDIIFSKGLEFKTAESSQVKAVLGGRVAFSGSMPGYDMVVIIDHGLRSYSLYGRLGKAFVAKGDMVKRGASLGVTSAPDTKGRNFYFETRKNGNPVDPSTVLARAS